MSRACSRVHIQGHKQREFVGDILDKLYKEVHFEQLVQCDQLEVDNPSALNDGAGGPFGSVPCAPC